MALSLGLNASLPTNYEYFTAGGVKSGLNADQSRFHLNNKEVFIYSGAMHYFRIPRAYWRDRLKKMRAAGLNTVETYIPWNLHEPRSGVYDFGDGNNDMSDFLHLQEFLTTAKEEDLFTIIRMGPFICAEWEFGGFPSWLLRENNIKVRTSDATYMKYVDRFFSVLLPILAMFQFTKGGPIISFQVENEYAISGAHDLGYLRELYQTVKKYGITELLTTADNPPKGYYGTIPELFYLTGNFNENITSELDTLKNLQPKRPVMVMEYWSGTADHWGQPHNDITAKTYSNNYELILKYPASVNVYMFVGSTNFGFMNGAINNAYDKWNTDNSVYTTSYDFTAPISEAGEYTEKYWDTRKLLQTYNPVKTNWPEPPAAPKITYYSSVSMQYEIFLNDIIDALPSQQEKNVISMEQLNINNNSGQSYGYIVYRKKNVDIPKNSWLKIEGRVCDTAMVLVNGILVSPWLEKASDLNRFGTWKVKDSSIQISTEELKGATIDIVVENWGRVNVGVYIEFKGLWQGGVQLNNNQLTDWTVYPLEFKKSFTHGLNGWRKTLSNSIGPAIYRGYLTISGQPEDTFVNMEAWKKGIVIVNGFVLGRYAKMGPYQTLYLPATLLKKGTNIIEVFEHFKPNKEVWFSDKHIYEYNK